MIKALFWRAARLILSPQSAPGSGGNSSRIFWCRRWSAKDNSIPTGNPRFCGSPRRPNVCSRYGSEANCRLPGSHQADGHYYLVQFDNDTRVWNRTAPKRALCPAS